MTLTHVCVFCGSSDGALPAYTEAAVGMGRALAARQITLVYGGGSTGIMGSLANAVLDAGGRVVGVITHHLNTPELAHPALTEMHVVASMHERKARMARLAEAFIALPGGLGTLEELLEVLTWTQIGLHRAPVGILDVADYFGPLHALLDHAQREGFLHNSAAIVLHTAKDPETLLDHLAARTP